jgi:hypothetical protein
LWQESRSFEKRPSTKLGIPYPGDFPRQPGAAPLQC